MHIENALCSEGIQLFNCKLLSDSDGDSDADSELDERVDGVKSWLSKNKGSSKAFSDDGSLKSSRLVNVNVQFYLLVIKHAWASFM